MKGFIITRNISHSISRNAKSFNKAFLLDGCRTPIGSFQKGLAPLSAPQLGAACIGKTLERVGGGGKTTVDEVMIGQVCQAGVGQAPARQAALNAGLSTSTPCTTINKVCASGMKSIMFAAQSIMLGHNRLVIAGGQESMSNVPFYQFRAPPTYGGLKLPDGIVHDGLTDAYNHCHMGVCAEKTAKELGLTRQAQDEFASESYSRAINAMKSGKLDGEIEPIQVPINPRKKEFRTLDKDEEYSRADLDLSRFTQLKSAFIKDQDGGTITAANASTLSDGACIVLIGGEDAISANKLTIAKPLAEIIDFADASVDPMDFGVAPVQSSLKLMKQNGLTSSDIDLWEINEAFSAVALANIKLLKLDAKRVNPNGGAVSIGHPIGMSGARIVLHLAHQLEAGQLGIAAICNGGGGASSILIKGC